MGWWDWKMHLCYWRTSLILVCRLGVKPPLKHSKLPSQKWPSNNPSSDLQTTTSMTLRQCQQWPGNNTSNGFETITAITLNTSNDLETITAMTLNTSNDLETTTAMTLNTSNDLENPTTQGSNMWITRDNTQFWVSCHNLLGISVYCRCDFVDAVVYGLRHKPHWQCYDLITIPLMARYSYRLLGLGDHKQEGGAKGTGIGFREPSTLPWEQWHFRKLRYWQRELLTVVGPLFFVRWLWTHTARFFLPLSTPMYLL